MNINNQYKLLRISYLLFTSIILVSSFFSPLKIHIGLEDIIFIIILILSYTLISRYSIELKGSYISFSDYIIIICYFIFNIKIVFMVLILSNILLMIVDLKYSYEDNPVIDNRHIFNLSLLIISSFLAHICLNFFINSYLVNLDLLFQIAIFSFTFLIFNYCLFFIDNFVRKNAFVLSSFYDEFIYFSINFILSATFSYLSLYLYNIFQYALVIVLTLFLIFLSYSLNRISYLKTKNSNLLAIVNCSNTLMSKTNYMNKLYNTIESIETILPFSYCGIYLFINNHEYVYPLCYKSKFNLEPSSYKFKNLCCNEAFNLITTGKPLYTNNKELISSLPIFQYENRIKSILVFPIKTSEGTIGCTFIAFNKYKNIEDKMDLISSLNKNLSLLCEDTINNCKTYHKPFTKYNEFLELLDRNINQKLIFTLAIIEIKDYSHIIDKYNLEVFQSLKKDVANIVHSMLSPYDSILYYGKDDIFLCFNLQDSLNAREKLYEISNHFEQYKFKNKISANIMFSYSEYPIDGINKEEIINKTYKNLYKLKNTL